ncbi:MAG: ferritin-like domain-containing protein, partial [Gemmatimonadales bacterium]
TNTEGQSEDPNEGPVRFPAGDFGVVNYAYALEQLEAAFYTRVIASFYAGASTEEQTILTDIKKHEVVHREFLKAALGGNAIADLRFDFSSVNFGNRESVLQTARTFEDLGVSAYNGAARFLSDPNLLLVAGKIVSVEARHAAAIRDLLRPRTRYFAGDDVVNRKTGLDVFNRPTRVARIAAPFFRRRFDLSTLPGSDR